LWVVLTASRRLEIGGAFDTVPDPCRSSRHATMDSKPRTADQSQKTRDRQRPNRTRQDSEERQAAPQPAAGRCDTTGPLFRPGVCCREGPYSRRAEGRPSTSGGLTTPTRAQQRGLRRHCLERSWACTWVDSLTDAKSTTFLLAWTPAVEENVEKTDGPRLVTVVRYGGWQQRTKNRTAGSIDETPAARGRSPSTTDHFLRFDQRPGRAIAGGSAEPTHWGRRWAVRLCSAWSGSVARVLKL